ncbi:F-box protein [Cardamine amara subsp. amara]|uniref:F-box protein n=1 Tax=Cardamine amara subsp. amara TaxID=228776 RepID=A0ABD1C919_CARAN
MVSIFSLAQNVINLSLVQKLHATSVWLWKSLSSGGSPTALNETVPAFNISLTTKESPCVRSANETIMISVSIPNELILEVLSRLPAKSVARFSCVSKLWASIVYRPYFTELFLTRSSARPRLLFALEEDGVWSFFSLPQHQNLWSHVVTADFHMKFPPDNMRIYSHRDRQFSCGYASGLFYLYAMLIKKEDYNGVPVICNPNTGRYVNLPYLYRFRQCYSFFGFDPIDKQFKVLFMAYPSSPDRNKILTFGTGELRWRRIKCSIKHEIVSEGICVNGILYYLGDRDGWGGFYEERYVIVCFDVRYEKFKFIYLATFVDRFINYKGKLGVIFNDHYTKDAKELRLWVLEDVEKQEWTKYAYTLRYDQFFSRIPFVVGVTAMGEIVLSMGEYTREEPFYVYYFNPERNTIQRVEIQGFGEYHKAFRNHVYTFVDHIEDLNYVNDAKLLQPRIYAPKEEEEESEEGEEEEE